MRDCRAPHFDWQEMLKLNPVGFFPVHAGDRSALLGLRCEALHILQEEGLDNGNSTRVWRKLPAPPCVRGVWKSCARSRWSDFESR